MARATINAKRVVAKRFINGIIGLIEEIKQSILLSCLKIVTLPILINKLKV